MDRKEIDIQKRQLEDLIRQKNAKIIDGGYIDNDSVNIVYKKICDKVLTYNKK
jgi:hypothetical protein